MVAGRGGAEGEGGNSSFPPPIVESCTDSNGKFYTNSKTNLGQSERGKNESRCTTTRRHSTYFDTAPDSEDHTQRACPPHLRLRNTFPDVTTPTEVRCNVASGFEFKGQPTSTQYSTFSSSDTAPIPSSLYAPSDGETAGPRIDGLHDSTFADSRAITLAQFTLDPSSCETIGQGQKASWPNVAADRQRGGGVGRADDGHGPECGQMSDGLLCVVGVDSRQAYQRFSPRGESISLHQTVTNEPGTISYAPQSQDGGISGPDYHSPHRCCCPSLEFMGSEINGPTMDLSQYTTAGIGTNTGGDYQGDGGGGTTPQATLVTTDGSSRATQSRVVCCVCGGDRGDRTTFHVGPQRHSIPSNISGKRSTEHSEKNSAVETIYPSAKPIVADSTNRILAGIFRAGTSSKRPVTPAEWSSPIHVKSMSRADWLALELLIEEAWPSSSAYDTEKRKLWKWLVNCVKHPDTVENFPAPDFLEEAELTDKDVEELLAFQYIVEVFDTRACATVKVFTVLEKDGSRRRAIFHPKLINQFLQDAGFMTGVISLPTVLEQIQQCEQTPGAMCVDGTAFYTQFPSEAPLLFTHNGRVFRPASICTGQRQCVAFAQVVLSALVQVTRRRHPMVLFLPYIDNVRFAGNLDQCNQAWTYFNSRALSVSLQFEIQSEWSAEYTFLGIHYTHGSEKTSPKITLGEKAQKKLAFWATKVSNEAAHFSMGDIVSLFGLLQWGTTVLQLLPAPFYYILKFLRRRGNKQLDDPANVWPSIIPLFHFWISSLANKNRPLNQVKDATQDIYVFTDASLEGFGVVVYFRNQIHISAGIFSRLEPIHVLEARAWLSGLKFVSRILENSQTQSQQIRCHFKIDNTSIIHAHERGRSTNFILNQIIGQLHPTLRTMFADFSVSYVRSIDNHADLFSRLRTNMSTVLDIQVDIEAAESAFPFAAESATTERAAESALSLAAGSATAAKSADMAAESA